MRKLVYSINLTADGCCDHTKGLPGEDVHDFYTQTLKEASTFLYGRKTYELMVPYWPDLAKSQTEDRSSNEFARVFDSIPEIVVFSRTLEKTHDKRHRIVRSGLKEEIMKMKQQPGKDILLGGVDLPSQLAQLDLIDEYLFVIHPVVVGEGRRLFDNTNLRDKLVMKLTESKTFPSGFITLRYARN